MLASPMSFPSLRTSAIAWPGGPVGTHDPGEVADVPAPKVSKAKAKAASSGGGRRHNIERYSSSYTSIALVPVPFMHRVKYVVKLLQITFDGSESVGPRVATCFKGFQFQFAAS